MWTAFVSLVSLAPFHWAFGVSICTALRLSAEFFHAELSAWESLCEPWSLRVQHIQVVQCRTPSALVLIFCCAQPRLTSIVPLACSFSLVWLWLWAAA